MNWKVKSISASVIFLLLAFAGVVVWGRYEVQRGFSARLTPSSIEVWAASTARKLAVLRQYKSLRNPFSASPEIVHAGMEHFADHCAACHANEGSGDAMFGHAMPMSGGQLMAHTVQIGSSKAPPRAH